MSSTYAYPPLSLPQRALSLPRTRPLLRAPRPTVLRGAAVLCLGILLSAVTTTDPLWWHLHFSRLGMFSNASGVTFNAGVIISGLVISASAIPLAASLQAAASAGRIRDPRAARALPPILFALGVFLSLIGVIPLTLNEFLHDRAANGVLLSFLGLVVVSRFTLRELPRFLGRFALTAVIALSIGIALMVSSVINLAAFEVLAFGSVLSWVHLLCRSAQRLGAATDVPDTAFAATDAPSNRRHLADVTPSRPRIPAILDTRHAVVTRPASHPLRQRESFVSPHRTRDRGRAPAVDPPAAR